MTKEIEGKTYYMRGDGTLVPEEQVKPKDRLRDQFVMDTAMKMAKLRTEMIRLKAEVVDDIDAFMEMMAEEYDVHLGGDKGNLTFSSFDGNVQIQYSQSNYTRYNEGIYIAKQLIDEFMDDITKDSSSSIRQIVEAAFSMRQGHIDPKAIARLRSINETDPRWVKAMQIIDESRMVVPGSKNLRLYVRNKISDKMELQSLDFSGIQYDPLPPEDEEEECVDA